MLVALHRIEHGFRFAQFAALGEAAGIEDQAGGVGVVVGQQLLQQVLGFADAAFIERGLGGVQQIALGRSRHLYVGFEHGADG
ncbi:hypothetical protein D3C85_1828080 [compost metagenome]